MGLFVFRLSWILGLVMGLFSRSGGCRKLADNARLMAVRGLVLAIIPENIPGPGDVESSRPRKGMLRPSKCFLKVLSGWFPG